MRATSIRPEWRDGPGPRRSPIEWDMFHPDDARALHAAGIAVRVTMPRPEALERRRHLRARRRPCHRGCPGGRPDRHPGRRRCRMAGSPGGAPPPLDIGGRDRPARGGDDEAFPREGQGAHPSPGRCARQRGRGLSRPRATPTSPACPVPSPRTSCGTGSRACTSWASARARRSRAACWRPPTG